MLQQVDGMKDFPYGGKGGGKHVLGLASLFEEEFSIDWLVSLTGMKASEILASLEEGVREGTLRSLGAGYFRFVNTEVRSRWSREARGGGSAELHNKIADILIHELGSDQSKLQWAIPHLLKGRNDLSRCKWLISAGDMSLRKYQTELAVQCYSKALEDLRPLHGEEEDHFFIESAIKYSKVSTARHDTGKVSDLLQEALTRARRWQRQPSEALLLMHFAKNDWLRSRYRSALKRFESGWALAKTLGDPKLLRSAKTFSTFFLYWQGRFSEAVESYEKSAAGVEKYPKGGYPLLAAALVGYCYGLTGQVTQGIGMLDAIRNSCLERGDEYLAAWGDFNIGKIMLDIRHIDNALHYLKSAVKEASKTRNDFISIHGKLVLAYAYYLLGDSRHAVSYLKDFLKMTGQVKMTVQPYPYIMDLCIAMQDGTMPRVQGLSLKSEVHRTVRSENIFMKGVAYRYKALLEKNEGLPPEKIIQTLDTSIRWLGESGHQIQLAKSQLELALMLLSSGKEEKAKAVTREVHGILGTLEYDLLPDELRPFVKKTDQSKDLLKEILMLGQEVVAIPNDKELMQHIISTVNRLAGAERGAVFLLESDGAEPRFQIKASKNLTEQQINDPNFRSSLDMVEEVALQGKGRILEMEAPAETSPAGDGPIRSRICVPMIFRDKVVGVLYHDNRLLSSAFKESDLELLAYFAALAAFAMDNVRAYEEVKRLNQKLNEEKLYYEERHLESLHFEDIVGESPAIRNVLNQAKNVAGTDTTVLITGETGVGKELVARAVHRNSPRRDKPFISVHCSSLPETLIPSELFGHEKGAFTGANRRRLGRFELADGGTLFMDEIGDLSLDVQTRLLRVLQNREFERLGGNETIRSDFRLIAATNRDLWKEIKAQRFRDDLYYRLNVFPIYVPPLRERKDDIPMLVHYFLALYSKKMGKSIERIPKAQMQKLMKYDWPGNVRELENVMERGTILSVPPDFTAPELGMAEHEGEEMSGYTLAENERRHILWALRTCGWKVRGPGGSAELLDIHPSTLAFRMKKLGIQRPEGVPRRRTGDVSGKAGNESRLL